MRILHGADFHLGRTTHSSPGTTSRADDFANTLAHFADVATSEKVDLALIAGDTFHTRRPAPRDLFALTSALSKLQEAEILTIVAPGNHDGADTVGDERTQALAWMKAIEPKNVRVLTSPTHGLLTTPRKDIQINIVSTPYPHKRSFDAVMPDASPEERVEAISVKFEQAITAMREQVSQDSSTLNIFLGHLSVVGAALGSEVTMRFGWDVTVRSGIFDTFDYAALGHIHRQQQISDKAWYAGSPQPMDFGESGQKKGFLLTEVTKRGLHVESIDSHPRPMLTVELHQEGNSWRQSAEIPDGAIVDVAIYPEENISPGEVLAIVRDIRKDGASYVRSHVVLPERESVRVQVDSQVEAGEALRRWLVTNGYEPEPYLATGIELIAEVGARA